MNENCQTFCLSDAPGFKRCRVSSFAQFRGRVRAEAMVPTFTSDQHTVLIWSLDASQCILDMSMDGNVSATTLNRPVSSFLFWLCHYMHFPFWPDPKLHRGYPKWGNFLGPLFSAPCHSLVFRHGSSVFLISVRQVPPSHELHRWCLFFKWVLAFLSKGVVICCPVSARNRIHVVQCCDG